MSLWDQLDTVNENDEEPAGKNLWRQISETPAISKQPKRSLWTDIGVEPEQLAVISEETRQTRYQEIQRTRQLAESPELSLPTEIAFGALRGLTQIPGGLAQAGQAIYSQPEAIGRKFAEWSGQDYDQMLAKTETGQAQLESMRDIAGAFGVEAKEAEKARQRIKPSGSAQRGESKLKYWAGAIPEVGGQLAAMLGAAAVVGPAPALALMSTSAGGQIYGDAKERMIQRGYTPQDAELIAFGEGTAGTVAEAALARLPFGEFIGGNRSKLISFVSRKLAASRPGRFLGAATAESIEEAGTEATQMIVQWLAENDPKALEDAAQRVGTAAILGFAGGSMIAGPQQIAQQLAVGTPVQEAKQIAAQKQVVRDVKHLTDLADMTRDISSTPEGQQKLAALSQIAEPTRKDFEGAGYDPRRMRLNAEQRKAYAQALSRQFTPPVTTAPTAPTEVAPGPIEAAPPAEAPPAAPQPGEITPQPREVTPTFQAPPPLIQVVSEEEKAAILPEMQVFPTEPADVAPIEKGLAHDEAEYARQQPLIEGKYEVRPRLLTDEDAEHARKLGSTLQEGDLIYVQGEYYKFTERSLIPVNSETLEESAGSWENAVKVYGTRSERSQPLPYEPSNVALAIIARGRIIRAANVEQWKQEQGIDVVPKQTIAILAALKEKESEEGKPDVITSEQEPYRAPEAVAQIARPSRKITTRPEEAAKKAEDRLAEAEAGAPRRTAAAGPAVEVEAQAAGYETVEAAETAARESLRETQAQVETPAAVAETLKDYETPETLAERESFLQQGNISWNPRTGPKGTRTGKPKPAREVVRDLLARVGIIASTYDVHTRGPGIVGFYRWITTRSQLLQTTGRELWLKASHLVDIGTAVHEVAHFIDQKYNISGRVEQLSQLAGIQPQGQPGFLFHLPPTTQLAFRMLDYHFVQHGQLRQDSIMGMAEGWAEAIRIYTEATDPGAALPLPIKDVIDSIVLANPDIAKLLNDTRSEVQAYLNASDAEKVSMAMQDPNASLANPSESYFVRQDRTGMSRGKARLIIKKLANRIKNIELWEERLERLFKEHFKQSGIDPEAAWNQFLIDTGGKVSQTIMYAQPMIINATDYARINAIRDPIDGQIIGTSMRNIFRDFSGMKEVDKFGRYMFAKTAMLRKAMAATQGKEYIVPEGLSDTILNNTISAVESGPDAQKFNQAMNEVTQYFNNLLDLLVKYNLLTRDAADAMITMHDIYMPFYHQLDLYGGRGVVGKFLQVTAPVRRLAGGNVMPVLDVYYAMVERTTDVMSSIIRKNVQDKFLKQAELSGVSGDFVRKLTAEEAEHVKDVTTIKTASGTYRYQIDPDLKDELQYVMPHMGEVAADMLRIASAPSILAKNMMVRYNIFYFPQRNYIVDMKTFALRGLQDMTGIDVAPGPEMNIQALVKPYERLWKGESDFDRLYDQYGGPRSTRVKSSRDIIRGGFFTKIGARAEKRRALVGAKQRGTLGALVDWATNTANFTESVNDAFEQAPRKVAAMTTLQLLQNTPNAGYTIDKYGSITGRVPEWAMARAMYNSFESTTNFNKRGEWQPVLEAPFLFYNASIRGRAGQIKTIKNAIKNKKSRKRLQIAIAIAATAKLAYYMYAALDKDEDGISALDKWAEVPDYLKQGNDVWMIMGIPVPVIREREWGLFSYLVDIVVGEYVKEGKVNPWKDAQKMSGAIAEHIASSLPITGGPAPVVGQLYFGYDIYRQRDIESLEDQGVFPQYRYDDQTSMMGKILGSYAQYTGLSPKETDFVLRNQFGSMVPKLYDFAVGTEEGRKLQTYPIIGPLLHDPVARQSVMDYNELKRRSSMELDVWERDRQFMPQPMIDRLLDNEEAIAFADKIKSTIYDSDMPNDAKQKYTTGLARWVLGRKPLAAYPNPMLEYENADIPLETRVKIIKALQQVYHAPAATETIPKGTEKYQAKLKARLGLLTKISTKE